MNNSHGMNNSRVTSLGTEKFFKIIESKGSTVLPSNWFSTNYSCGTLTLFSNATSLSLLLQLLTGRAKLITTSKICLFGYTAATFQKKNNSSQKLLLRRGNETRKNLLLTITSLDIGCGIPRVK